jgi:hypothetical protein
MAQLNLRFFIASNDFVPNLNVCVYLYILYVHMNKNPYTIV